VVSRIELSHSVLGIAFLFAGSCHMELLATSCSIHASQNAGWL
jgi:hypothetical protein